MIRYIYILSRFLAIVGPLLCGLPACGQKAETGQRSRAESLIAKMPGVGDLLEVPTQEGREALVRERGKKDARLSILLSTAGYYYEKEGNIAAARAWDRLREAAVDAYDESQADRSSEFFEVKERLRADVELSKGDDFGNRGEYLNALQHHLLALDYLVRAKQRRSDMGLPPFSEMDRVFHGDGVGLHASVCLRINSDYTRLGDMHRARVYEDRAYEAAKDSAKLENYAVARQYEANRAIASERPHEAREILRKAIDHIFAPGNLQKGGYLVPLDDMVHLYRTAAQLASDAGEHDEAVRLCDQAIAWGSKKLATDRLFLDHVLKAKYQGRAGRLKEAEATLAASRTVLSRLGEKSPDAAIPPRERYFFYSTSGEIRSRAAAGDDGRALDAAAADFRKAIEAVEILQGSDQIVTDPSASATAQFASAYEGLVSILFRKFRQNPSRVVFSQALQVAEQRSARRFLEGASWSRTQLLNALPATVRMLLVPTDRRYRQLLNYLKSQPLDAETRLKVLTELEGEFKNRQEYLNVLRGSFPRAMELLYPTALSVARLVEDLLQPGAVPPTPAAAPETVHDGSVRAIRPPDRERSPVELPLKGIAFVRYFIADDAVFLFYISSKRIEIVRSPADPDHLRSKIHVFRRALADPNRNVGSELSDIGRPLSEGLIAPIDRFLDQDGDIETLVIVPDSFLFTLPFEALVIAKGSPRPRYLLDRVAVVYSPSLAIYRLLLEATNRTRVGPSWFLGIGDPEYPTEAEGGRERDEARDSRTPIVENPLGILRRGGLRLNRLINSRLEVEGIGALFGQGRSKLLFGPDATKARLKDLSIGNYDFVHFAVHGLLPGQLGLVTQPTLALTPGKDRTENGLLTLTETFNLRLHAHLTVLSSCNTGVGPSLGAEGIDSFNRALLMGGSDNILVSLWSVEDRSTAMLMGRFYRELLAGAAPPQALRRAKLWLIDQPIPLDERHAAPDTRPPSLPGRFPFFWSGFVLSGTHLPVRFEEPTDSSDLGSPKAPVKCEAAPGEREYLDRLRCPDGLPVTYKRAGNVGVGAFGHIVDLYDIECQDHKHRASVMMDFYFWGYRERRPIPGFRMQE